MRDDPSVVALVTRAAGGDQDAWNEIVERYAPLVWSICLRYQLSRHDTEDVGQTVWLLLVAHLRKLREPAALPGWLAATTAHECLRLVRAASKFERLGGDLADALQLPGPAAVEQEILAAERNAGLRAALTELPARCRQLLSMLISDPPPSYEEIHVAVGIPVGSIGPQRARCLQRLRKSSYLIGLGEGEITVPGGEARAQRHG